MAIDRQLNHPDLQTDWQWLIQIELSAYAATGERYEELKAFLSTLNELQKGELFANAEIWPRAVSAYTAFLHTHSDSLSPDERANLQNRIAIAYIKQSKPDSALVFLKPALQVFEQLQDKEMVGTLYNNLGSAHKLLQDWASALHWLRKSVSHNRTAAGDSASVLGFTYYHLAEVFHQYAQPDSAVFYVKKSLALRQALGLAEQVAETVALREKIMAAQRAVKK